LNATTPHIDGSQLLTALFEQSHDAVFIIDLDARYVSVNQRAADLLGYTRAEMMGMHNRQVVAPEYLKQSDDIYQRLLRHEAVPVYERVALRKDGTRVPVEVSVELIRDSAGTPRYIQSIVRDITVRKDAERQALALALETERSHILADFIIAASHEFRTPLANINTSLHILRQTRDESAREQRIDGIQAHVDRLADLVSRMLLLTRLESDTSFHFAALDLTDVLYDAEISHMRAIESKGLSVRHHFEQDLPRCWGDVATLHIVFRELIDNAIKMAPAGSEITIGTESRSGYVMAAIRDQGDGIDIGDQPFIFDRFFRADKTHHQRGFGLGLSIAKMIVDQHSGVIEVETAPGEGSTFRVVLPVA